MKMSEILKEKLESMSDEEYMDLWNSPEVVRFKDVGPTIDEYLGYNKDMFGYSYNAINSNYTKDNSFIGLSC